MDFQPVLPVITTYAAAQASFPVFFCGVDICSDLNWGAAPPGIFLLGLAVSLVNYGKSNRLLLDTTRGVGIARVEGSENEIVSMEDFIPYEGIQKFWVTPLGMVIQKDSGGYGAFPVFWDASSVRDLLEERTNT